MGSSFTLSVPSESSTSKTGKKTYTYTEYTGTGLRGSYDSDFSTSDTVVKAGDVKFVCYFDDESFEPKDKNDYRLIFDEINYTVIHVKPVEPSETNICYVLQLRRVN